MIAKGLDQELFDKTVALARETGGFSATYLRAAFDASPLWGAGRVGGRHLQSHRACCDARRSHGRRAIGPIVRRGRCRSGNSPWWLRRASRPGLDIDWDDPDARKTGLSKLLGQVQALGRWLDRELKEQLKTPPLQEQWALVQKLIAQDTEPDPGRWRRAANHRWCRQGQTHQRQRRGHAPRSQEQAEAHRRLQAAHHRRRRHSWSDLRRGGDASEPTRANGERDASRRLESAEIETQRALHRSRLSGATNQSKSYVSRGSRSTASHSPSEPAISSTRATFISTSSQRRSAARKESSCRCAWVRVPISRPRSATPAPNVTRALVPSPAEAAVSAFTRTNPSCSTSGGRPSPRKAAPT